jgi:hypothetical protein
LPVPTSRTRVAFPACRRQSGATPSRRPCAGARPAEQRRQRAARECIQLRVGAGPSGTNATRTSAGTPANAPDDREKVGASSRHAWIICVLRRPRCAASARAAPTDHRLRRCYNRAGFPRSLDRRHLACDLTGPAHPGSRGSGPWRSPSRPAFRSPSPAQSPPSPTPAQPAPAAPAKPGPFVEEKPTKVTLDLRVTPAVSFSPARIRASAELKVPDDRISDVLLRRRRVGLGRPHGVRGIERVRTV